MKEVEFRHRIKYKEVKPGVFRSALNFVTQSKIGGIYSIELDFNTMIYYVINVSQKRVIKTNERENVKINNKAVLKRKAKRAIKELGVSFGYELRLK